LASNHIRYSTNFTRISANTRVALTVALEDALEEGGALLFVEWFVESEENRSQTDVSEPAWLSERQFCVGLGAVPKIIP